MSERDSRRTALIGNDLHERFSKLIMMVKRYNDPTADCTTNNNGIRKACFCFVFICYLCQSIVNHLDVKHRAHDLKMDLGNLSNSC